jgi:hypothetical protein
MADPQLAQETASHVNLIAGGAAGAAASVYLRHPGTIVKAVVQGGISIALAGAFGPTAHAVLAGWGFNDYATGATVGLTGLTIAGGLLKALERIDFAAWLPGKGKADV